MPGFVFLLLVGVGLLWLGAMVATFLEMGDCFGSDAQCEALWGAQATHDRVLVLLLLGTTAIGFAAALRGRIALPTILAIVAGGDLALAVGSASGRDAVPPWTPNGLFFLAPALLTLAVASLYQILASIGSRARRTGGG
jgi:hypothetical protein